MTDPIKMALDALRISIDTSLEFSIIKEVVDDAIAALEAEQAKPPADNNPIGADPLLSAGQENKAAPATQADTLVPVSEDGEGQENPCPVCGAEPGDPCNGPDPSDPDGPCGIEYGRRVHQARQAPATQAAEPRCWLYTNNSGVQVIHWHSGTPIFLADQAAAQKWPSTHRLEPLYAHPPVAQPLSEREIVACLAAAGCFGTVRMSYETGPYDIDRTTVNSDKLATELQRAFCAKNGITLAGKEKP